jgi:hypothetical protein
MVDELSDLGPTLLGNYEVRAGRELLVVRHRGGLLVKFPIDSVEHRRREMVLAAGDKQKRSTIIIAMVDLIGGPRIEIAKGDLKDRTARAGNYFSFVELQVESSCWRTRNGTVQRSA